MFGRVIARLGVARTKFQDETPCRHSLPLNWTHVSLYKHQSLLTNTVVALNS